MRKTILTALVTLLVLLAVVSCENFTGEKPEYTADGKRLVTLNVKVGRTAGDRALTNDLAHEEADFMEVILKSGTRYYRAEGLLAQTIKIRIPADTYNKDNAVLLIGRASDDTLLAVGTLAVPVNVTSNTTLTFSIKSLTTALYAGGTGLNVPTFVIDETSGTPAINSADGGKFAGKTANSTFVDGKTTCFQVPTSTVDIMATLTISGFNDNTANDSLVLAGDKDVIFTPKDTVETITFDPATDAAVTFTDGTCKIGLTFETAGFGGYIITFKIPVVGFAKWISEATTPGLGNQKIWNIRGGTIPAPNGYQPIIGTGEEGIALLVTPNAYKLVTATIGPIATW